MKAVQWVRAADVVVLGPFLVWAGARESTLPGWARAGLVASGLLTTGYNAINFVRELD